MIQLPLIPATPAAGGAAAAVQERLKAVSTNR